MRFYPKIETLFQRDEQHNVTDVLKNPVLADINPWIVTEKVDGMNMRVGFRKGDALPKIAGRSDRASIPSDLLVFILAALPQEKRDTLFNDGADPSTEIVLFGEGYGAGIQKGAGYCADKRFILFDALIDVNERQYWMPPQTTEEWAVHLGIDHVPTLGHWSLSQIVDHVRTPFKSRLAECEAEGIVARPRAVLFDARGNRLMLKLKTHDFVKEV